MINWDLYIQYITNELVPRFTEIIITPWLHKETLWMVIPLILILFLIQAYFGRYKTEQLGWNTAFGNTVSLFWVTVLLTKFLVESTPTEGLLQGHSLRGFILIAVLFTWTLLLLVSDYFHTLPRRIAFFLSSTIPINIIAYIFIVLIVGEISLDRTTILASFIFIICISIFFSLFRSLIEPSDYARKKIEEKHDLKIQEKNRRKQARKEKIESYKEKISQSFDFLKPREPKL